MSTISFIAARAPSDDDDVDRDTYTTPRWLTRAIGPVWLDPCSNIYSKVQAERTFRLDRGQDGLKLARYVPRNPPGIVFVNPPYSRGQVLKWIRAYRHTRFVFLLRHDPSTKWFRELFEASSALVHPFDRINFDPPPGTPKADGNHNNPFPHSLCARDEADISAALRKISMVLRPVKGIANA